MLAEHVREALSGIPEAERRPIELAYFGGHSYREVAQLLGEPEGHSEEQDSSGTEADAPQPSTAGVLVGGES